MPMSGELRRFPDPEDVQRCIARARRARNEEIAKCLRLLKGKVGQLIRKIFNRLATTRISVGRADKGFR
jgi:hypothetical protein